MHKNIWSYVQHGNFFSTNIKVNSESIYVSSDQIRKDTISPAPYETKCLS